MSSASHIEIEHLLDAHGAVARQHHPELARALGWLTTSGRLSAVLPGVYVRAADAADHRARVRALQLLDPNAVLTRRTAASLSFWPDLRVSTVTAAVGSHRVAPPGYSFERRRVCPELVRHHQGVYLTSPALTSLDLVSELGGDAIDRALRVGAVTLGDLRRALELTPHRRGNRQRRETVVDSRDVPWARSERVLHRLLRNAGVVGWRTNVPVTLAEGRFFLDVAFEDVLVALEVDGWEFHARHPGDFDATLRRHSALESAGWRVLHFTWAQLVEEPDWVLAKVVATVQRQDPAVIGLRRRTARLTGPPVCP